MAYNPNNSANVSVGKGKVGGYLFSAPLKVGTTPVVVPTDATTALDEAFVNLGYVSDDGITKALETESEDFKDLNGDSVMTVITSRTETFNFNLMETREEVLKEIYGQGNVTVDATTGAISVKENSTELPNRIYVMEFVLSGNRAMRVVVPIGKITELGDQTFQSGDTIKYEATVSCFPDGDGNTVYTYIQGTTTANKASADKAGK